MVLFILNPKDSQMYCRGISNEICSGAVSKGGGSEGGFSIENWHASYVFFSVLLIFRSDKNTMGLAIKY